MKADVILSKVQLKAVHALFRLQWQDICAIRGEAAAEKFTEFAHFRQNFVPCSPWRDECKFLADLTDGRPDVALHLFNTLSQSHKKGGSKIFRSKSDAPQDLRHIIYSSTMPHHCPLHIAASKGYTQVVARLLQVGCDINLPDMMGHTSLCLATEQKQIDVVRQLIAAGADVNRYGLAGWSPLIIASRLGHLDLVKELTAAPDINLHLLDCCGRNAAAHAIAGGHSDVLAHLLTCGIDINQIDYRGRSLSDELNASRAPSYQRATMQSLLAHADLRQASLQASGIASRGQNLLSGPVDTTTLVSMMTAPDTTPALRQTASVLKFASSGYTPPAPETPEGRMLAAMERKDHHEVRVIAANELESNPHFDFNVRNAQGLTILFMAVEQRNSSIIHFSLRRGADPNIGNALDVTPLMKAIESRNEGLAAIFLACERTDPTRTDYAGRTARDYAEEQGQRKLVSKLAEAETAWRIKTEKHLSNAA